MPCCLIGSTGSSLQFSIINNRTYNKHKQIVGSLSSGISLRLTAIIIENKADKNALLLKWTCHIALQDVVTSKHPYLVTLTTLALQKLNLFIIVTLNGSYTNTPYIR